MQEGAARDKKTKSSKDEELFSVTFGELTEKKFYDGREKGDYNASGRQRANANMDVSDYMW